MVKDGLLSAIDLPITSVEAQLLTDRFLGEGHRLVLAEEARFFVQE